jgi:hypothetical protein
VVRFHPPTAIFTDSLSNSEPTGSSFAACAEQGICSGVPAFAATLATLATLRATPAVSAGRDEKPGDIEKETGHVEPPARTDNQFIVVRNDAARNGLRLVNNSVSEFSDVGNLLLPVGCGQRVVVQELACTRRCQSLFWD